MPRKGKAPSQAPTPPPADSFLFPKVGEEEIERQRELLRTRMANLTPFRPGQSGNPNGRAKNAGMSLKEWLNALCDTDPDGTPRYAMEEIELIYRDPREPVTKRMAAKMLCTAMQTGITYSFDAEGNAYPGRMDPEPNKVLAEILDRTLGKATMTVAAGMAPPQDFGEAIAQLRTECERDPALKAAIMEMVVGELPAGGADSTVASYGLARGDDDGQADEVDDRT
jgi:hypothetical protein